MNGQGAHTRGGIGLGRVAGLSLSVMPSAIAGSIVLWVVLSGVGVILIQLPAIEAVVGGLIAVGLHWVLETAHQLGHARAARRAGYPMIGIRYWGVLSTSVYPPDEPALPASVHIRRALGGPIASAALTLPVGLIAVVLSASGGLLRWIALFAFAENLLVFTLGAFLPLGFTDGTTLLHWWGKRE